MSYDFEIREPLFIWLEERCGKIRIIEEKTIGPCRADALMVTEASLCGIEIKSDSDTYARLPGQVAAYDRYFDYNLLVAGTSHAMHVEEHIPPYWGIVTTEKVNGAFDFYCLRRAKPNPAAQLKNKLSLLWRPELNTLLSLNSLPALREKSKKYVISRLAAAVPAPLLTRQVSALLFERDYTSIDAEIAAYKNKRRSLKGRR